MGWWRPAGKSFTIGDGPLDTLGSAVDNVVRECVAALGRRPTPEEWQALLGIALGSEPPGQRFDASANPAVQLVFPERPERQSAPVYPDLPIPELPHLRQCAILGFDFDVFSRRTEPRIDILLRNHRETVSIRFWDPREFEVSRGGPPPYGLVVSDISSAPVGNATLRVPVDDTSRAFGFVARALEIRERQKHPHLDE